jgi:hypothetical protein
MDVRRQCKKYSVSPELLWTSIEIPPEMDQPGIFHPTIGPKVLFFSMGVCCMEFDM